MTEQPATSRQANTELLKAIEPIAMLAHDYDLAALDDEAVIEVPCKHIRKAWVVFAKFAGDGS